MKNSTMKTRLLAILCAITLVIGIVGISSPNVTYAEQTSDPQTTETLDQDQIASGEETATPAPEETGGGRKR